MKTSNIILCTTMSLLSVASGRLSGSDPIDVDHRDNVIVENCDGHRLDEVIYFMAPENSCTTPDGLMGVWGCRQEPQEHSVCLPSAGSTVIGKVGDQCGCCNGVCPSLCKCRCDGGVYVREIFLFGFKRTRCAEEGLAEAMVLEQDGVECYTKC
jgi:hypothetical protein